MYFEHLIQINDPLLPLLAPLTRTQLWRGLVRRAETPTEFVLGLQGAVVHARHEHEDRIELARTLDFGSFTVADRVALVPLREVKTQFDATAHYPAGRLTIRIEEPEPDALYLRFIYDADERADDGARAAMATADDPDDDGMVDDAPQTHALRRQAYELADLDTVARIRALAAAGELGE